MEDILRSLGAVTETESDVQRDVIRERIINSIVFPDDPLNAAIPSSVEGAPELSESNMRLLISEVHREKDEIKGSCRDSSIAEMKMLFIRGLLKLRGIDIDVDAIPPAPRVQTYSASSSSVASSVAASMQVPRARQVQSMSIKDIKNLPTHHVDSGRRSHYRGGGDLGLQEARLQTAIKGNASQNWNIDVSSIKALNEEARRSSLMNKRVNVEAQDEVAEVFELENKNVDIPTALADTDDIIRNKRVKRETHIEDPVAADAPSMTIGDGGDSNSVTCPLCGVQVEVAGRNVTVIMDSHIDRCSRRTSVRTRRGQNNATSTGTTADSVAGGAGASSSRNTYEEDWMDDGSDDDAIGTRTRSGTGRLRKSSKSKSSGDSDAEVVKERRSRNAAGTAAGASSVIVPAVAKKGHKKKPSVGGLDAIGLGLFDRKANNKGRIQEDKAYFDDDWEDDVYLNRLCEIGVFKRVENDDGSMDRTRMELVVRPFVTTEYGTEVDEAAWNSLYDYQKEGIRWLYELYDGGVGGILGDEMGLGKTAQLSVHFGSLSRLYRQQQGRSGIFLIVCPATVLQHWLKELRRWVPEMRCVIMHTISKTGGELHKLGEEGVEYVLRKLQKYDGTRGLTVLVTYEGLRRHKDSLNRIEWTGVCLDEGQKIRNPAADISIVCKMLPSYHRIILSGTPIQNSLRELWSLFDFIYPGRLGTLPVFELEFCEPIRSGGYRNATKLQAEVAVRCAATLQRIVKPYLLRRKKDDLTATTKLPQKTEQVLFCRLSDNQRMIYRSILSSDEVSAVLSRRSAPFRAINTLRKLCNHPVLAFRSGRVVWDDPKPSKKAAAGGAAGASASSSGKSSNKSGKNNGDDDDNVNDDDDDDLTGALSSEDLRWEDSGKLMVLGKVLPLWYNEGHKVLLFSQTQSMLNLLEVMMKEFSFRYMRLDGSTPVSRREGIIETFNKDPTVFVMILSTRTGGVGISLTAANRVVLVDPDWNPQTDVQARERAWRIGQQRDVTIYRLICRGTIEEKIYQRQIFKLLLTKRILDDPKQKALFSKSDIKELFDFPEDDDGRGSFGTNSNGKNGSTPTNLSSTSALPREGEIVLAKSKGKPAPSSSSSSLKAEAKPKQPATDAPSSNGHRIRKQVVEDGEISEGEDKAADNKDDDDAFAPEVEEFVEQKLPEEARDADGDDEGDESNSRDRRLLKALFDGEALAAVYDHSAVEPGGGGDARSADMRRVRERASQIVDEALNRVKSSKPVYMVQDDAITANKSSAAVGGTTTAAAAAVSSSSSSSSAVQSPSAAPKIQISSQRNGGISGGGGSAQLLAGLRANKAGSTSTATQGGLNSSSSSTVPAAASSASVRGNISNRLVALFRNAGSARGGGLSSDYILQNFRDLGDQYASLFRDVLRQVAEQKEGRWYLRT